MAAWTAADIRLLLPEFCGVPLPTMDRYIALAEAQFSETLWGSQAKVAGVFLTAHVAAVAGVLGPAKGRATNVSVGDVSAGYAAAPAGLSAFAETTYGVEYARMSRGRGFGAALL
jgi:Protein of unknown function (DUF4054)